jgi:hypothetical protein
MLAISWYSKAFTLDNPGGFVRQRCWLERSSGETGTASQDARFLYRPLAARKLEGTIMNISGMRTRVDPLNERSRLVMRSAEPDENPTVKLVDTSQPNDAKSNPMPDPLIQALVDKLPKPNSIWSIDDRAKWLRAAAMLFNLIYRTDEGERKQPCSNHKTEGTPAAPSPLSAA